MSLISHHTGGHRIIDAEETMIIDSEVGLLIDCSCLPAVSFVCVEAVSSSLVLPSYFFLHDNNILYIFL